LDERFPQKFAVNNLQTESRKHPGLAPQPPWRKQKQGPTEKEPRENPNLIPLTNKRGESAFTNIEQTWVLDGYDGAPIEAGYTDETTARITSGWE
jgi:hypothetical protein